MSLLEKMQRINNAYYKKLKKSIDLPKRIDVFLIVVLFVIIASPFVIRYTVDTNAERKKKNLFLSPYCIELFGKEITEALIQSYNEANPDIKLQLFSIPESSSPVSKIFNKNSQIENSEPDIYLFEENEYRMLIFSGVLAKLNFYVEAGAETNLYAIPLVSFMDLLFYNIELLATAGFDRPPKTREEYLSYLKAVYGNNTESGASLSLSSEDGQALSRDIFSWLWAAGVDFWADENAPSFNTGTMARDMAFFGSLFNEGAFANDVFETTGDQRLEEFSNGRISMMIGSIRAIPFLRERMGDDAFGITTIPLPSVYSSTLNYNIGLSGIYAGINIDSLYPDEARSFIEFLAGQYDLFKEAFGPVFAVASPLIPGESIIFDPFYSKARDIYEASKTVKSFSGIPEAQKYEDAFLEELQAYLNGGKTAQEAAAAIQLQWDEISGM